MTQVTLNSTRLRPVAQFQQRFRLGRVSMLQTNSAMFCKGFVMNRMKSVLLVLGAVAISGCASMNADECANSDWTAVGYEDGSRGYTSDRFSNHRKACAKHGITADFQAYQDGRSDGLVEFCQPGRGFNLGAGGGRYSGVCSADLEPDFLDAYRVGQQLYTLRSNVNNTNALIYSKEQELEDIEAAIISKEALLIAAETTIEDRVLLLADLKRLSERTGELETEIELLIADRAGFQRDLQNYEQTVAAHGY